MAVVVVALVIIVLVLALLLVMIRVKRREMADDPAASTATGGDPDRGHDTQLPRVGYRGSNRSSGTRWGQSGEPVRISAGAEEVARQKLLEERGSELIERRVELDARRGTLGGDAELLHKLELLEERRRKGEISEEAFEREKTRLLGG